MNEQYNTNILLATDAGNVKEDYITTLSPGFDVSDKTARLDSLLSLRLDRLHYGRNEELDATNQNYGGSIRYSVTPRLNVLAAGSYTKNANPSLGTWSGTGSSPLPPTGNSNTGGGSSSASTILIPTTGNSSTGGGSTSASTTLIPLTGFSNTGAGNTSASTLPLVSSPVQIISSLASMDYQMTETTSLSALYQFGWSSYEQPQYRDTSHDAGAGLVIDLGKYLPRMKGRLNAGYSQYLLPNTRTTNVMGTIGFSYDISETWSLLVNGGLRHTYTELTLNQVPATGSGPLDQSETNGTGNLSLNYKGQYTGAELSYIQDFTMAYLATGHQAPADRKALSVTAQHQITPELSVLLKAGYTRYTVNGDLTQNDVIITPIIRYDLVQMSGERDLALEASYEHTRIDYAVSGTANRDLYFIRLSVRFPYCSSSQYK